MTLSHNPLGAPQQMDGEPIHVRSMQMGPYTDRPDGKIKGIAIKVECTNPLVDGVHLLIPTQRQSEEMVRGLSHVVKIAFPDSTECKIDEESHKTRNRGEVLDALKCMLMTQKLIEDAVSMGEITKDDAERQIDSIGSTIKVLLWMAHGPDQNFQTLLVKTHQNISGVGRVDPKYYRHLHDVAVASSCGLLAEESPEDGDSPSRPA